MNHSKTKKYYKGKKAAYKIIKRTRVHVDQNLMNSFDVRDVSFRSGSYTLLLLFHHFIYINPLISVYEI